MAQDALHHEVPVLVPNQGHSLPEQHIRQRFRLLRLAVLEEALHDAASIAVARELRGCAPALLADLVDDELTVAWWEQGDEPLNHVIPEGAAHRFPHMSDHLLCKSKTLLIGSALVNGTLDTPATRLLLGKQPHLALDIGLHVFAQASGRGRPDWGHGALRLAELRVEGVFEGRRGHGAPRNGATKRGFSAGCRRHPGVVSHLRVGRLGLCLYWLHHDRDHVLGEARRLHPLHVHDNCNC
mmetsp:Transcript_56701/g.126477  ORF Transcript_56701/g.126477 Transcript_56701/m.126477 type:complete len:240 (-) Transcript_56701:169-888(-)